MVSISLGGSKYSNNSAISMTEFKEDGDTLVCHTTFTACCTTADGGNNLGNWIYPNGTIVSSRGEGNSYYRSRISGALNLHYIDTLTFVSGIFTWGTNFREKKKNY